jgi:hypothetical protein
MRVPRCHAWHRAETGLAGAAGYDPAVSGIERDEHGNMTIKVPTATASAAALAPVVHITVLLDTLFAGFDQARARFQHAQTQREGGGVTYIPLQEALGWTTAINDRLKAEWGASQGGSQEWWDGLPNRLHE